MQHLMPNYKTFSEFLNNFIERVNFGFCRAYNNNRPLEPFKVLRESDEPVNTQIVFDDDKITITITPSSELEAIVFKALKQAYMANEISK